MVCDIFDLLIILASKRTLYCNVNISIIYIEGKKTHCEYLEEDSHARKINFANFHSVLTQKENLRHWHSWELAFVGKTKSLVLTL